MGQIDRILISVNRLLATVLGWILVFGMLLCSICSALAAWGDVDTTFTPGGGNSAGFDLDVTCIALQSDGKIIVGGGFTQDGRTSRNRIARLNLNGTLDTTFDPGTGANDTVWALAVQPDGRVVIAGQFTTVNGVPHSKVARLNANGSLDLSFNPAPDGTVAAMALQADGKVLISGAFTTVSGAPRSHVARLMSDGGVDSQPQPLPYDCPDWHARYCRGSA